MKQETNDTFGTKENMKNGLIRQELNDTWMNVIGGKLPCAN